MPADEWQVWVQVGLDAGVNGVGHELEADGFTEVGILVEQAVELALGEDNFLGTFFVIRLGGFLDSLDLGLDGRFLLRAELYRLNRPIIPPPKSAEGDGENGDGGESFAPPGPAVGRGGF